MPVQPPLPEIAVRDEALHDPGWRGLGADVLGVLVSGGPDPAGGDAAGGTADRPGGVGAPEAAALYGLDLSEELEDLRGAGSSAVVRLPRTSGAAAPWDGLPGTLVLLAAGEGPGDARRAGLALGRAAAGKDTVVLPVRGLGEDRVQALVEGFLLTSFRMPRWAREADGKPAPDRLVLLGAPATAALDRARAGVAATLLTRLLAATPSSTKNPAWVADRAVELAREVAGEVGETGTLDVRVRDETWLSDHGMGGIVAVGGGSATPPRLVTVAWTPGDPAAASVALVGKGITFDTGGISLKPREAMVPMKTDMAGAATVLAAVLGAARLALPVAVTAVLPLAENAIGAASYRPGDVVRTADGTTVEISNTDAEGRMVLADALAWAADELDPDVLVDVATLTGAAGLGLGRGHAALFATDDALADALLEAGARAGEPAWRMPLVADYRDALASDVADVAHAATDAHVGGGSITAALFLERFAHGRPWAHLDIAGAGRAGSKQGELPANAPTGYGARLLLGYLTGLAGSRRA